MDANKSTNLTATQIAGLNCPSCTNVNTARRTRRGDDTPIRTSSSNQALRPNVESPSSVAQAVGLSLSDISALLDQKLAPTSIVMKDLRAAWKEDVKSMIAVEINIAMKQIKEDFTTTTDFIMNEVKDLQKKISEKDGMIKSLENQQSELQKECITLNNRLSALEKASRGCNIEIQAVPEMKSENPMEIFLNLCKAINAPILDSEIRSCRRVAKMDTSTSRPRNILVTVASSRLRDNVLSASHRFNKEHPNNKLNSQHVGINGDTRRIYVSEHLSPDTKQLHFATRQFAKDNNYKFVWVKYGQIYLRKDIDAVAIRVTNKDFLKKIAQ